MSEVYFVTVGNSLFHSATWEGEEFEEFAKKEGFWEEYQNFLKKSDPGDPSEDGPLFVPEKRKQKGQVVEQKLKELILEDTAPSWTKYIAEYDPGNPKYDKRYSAEITTLLTLARMKGISPGELLADKEVYLVCDDSTQKGSTRHVAAHLKQVLIKICGDAATRDIHIKPIQGFSSHDPTNLHNALEKFNEEIENTLRRSKVNNIYLIVTGGFKVYSMIAARKIEKYVEAIYMHEEAEIVFTYKKNSDGKDILFINNNIATVN